MKIGNLEVSSQFTDSFGATMKVKKTGQYVERPGPRPILNSKLCESENSIPGSKGLLGFVSLPQTKLKHFVWGKHEPITPVILLHVMKSFVQCH